MVSFGQIDDHCGAGVIIFGQISKNILAVRPKHGVEMQNDLGQCANTKPCNGFLFSAWKGRIKADHAGFQDSQWHRHDHSISLPHLVPTVY